ncbi:CBS domain-containing protein [Foetidibacter luteolus]|uniref:CBS domain-containing protein n=1 Tax=Foetidibacter luteolus TaxID=2608880 RepID=UPI00129A3DF6|nr:CBS domain-containing protein [Foetidibacter luteolus]
MEITPFIKNDFPVTYPYADINSIRKELLHFGAVLVMGHVEEGLPLGVLTSADLAINCGNCVGEYLSSKPVTAAGCTVEDALQAMRSHHSDVLVINNGSNFEGLVLKEDLIAFMDRKKQPAKNAQYGGAARSGMSEKILKALYDNSTSLRILISPDFKILFLNKVTQYKSYMFYDEQLNEGDDLLQYLSLKFEKHNEGFVKHVSESLQQALCGENIVHEAPLRFSFAGGQDIVLWFRFGYYPVFDDGTLIGISVTVTDINEKKKHELFIEKQNKVLKEIIHTQSHEVRGPLANILGILNLVDTDQLSQHNKDAFEWLKTSALQLDEMIKNVVNKAGQWSQVEETKK